MRLISGLCLEDKLGEFKIAAGDVITIQGVLYELHLHSNRNLKGS